jgi:hypothetical protein
VLGERGQVIELEWRVGEGGAILKGQPGTLVTPTAVPATPSPAEATATPGAATPVPATPSSVEATAMPAAATPVPTPTQ